LTCRPVFLGVCLGVLLIAGSAAFARGSLEPLQPTTVPGQIVVGYNRTATVATTQSISALGAIQVVRSLNQIGAQVWRIPANADARALCAKLRAVPGVRYARPVVRRHVLLAAPNDPAYNNVDTYVAPLDPDFDPSAAVAFQWGLHRIQALQAWSVWPGAYYTAANKPTNAVKVAVIDTGIDVGGPDGIPHPDFINAGGTSPDAALGGQVDLANALNVNGNYEDPTFIDDDYGHGTATAGIIAAATNNGGTPQSPNVSGAMPSPDGIAGLAYNAQILPIKAMDSTGNGTDAELAAGILAAVDRGALIINISAGEYEYSQAEQDAVDYAWDHGTLVVCAAGNDGPSPNRPLWPAACTGVLAVSATGYDPNDASYDPLASYSNTGYYVNVSAPGGDYSLFPLGFWEIWCSMPTDGVSGQVVGWLPWEGVGAAPQYQYQLGTSLACPYVAGLAALYAGYKGITQETPDGVWQMWRAIQKGCDNATSTTGWSPSYGWGRINAYQTMLDNDNREATSGSMTGQVYVLGTVMGNAIVSAVPSAGGTAKVTNSKLADGYYRLSGLSPGTWNVTATYQGKSVTVNNVVVEAGVDTPRVYLNINSGGGGAALAVSSATYVDATHVDVTFNQAPDGATVATAANYSIAPALGVTAAAIQADTKVVRLTTAPQLQWMMYTVTVTNVTSGGGAPIAAPDNTAGWLAPGTPLLTWAGTAGFFRDGVNPNVGNVGKTFVFKIKVTQPDGTAPSWVKLLLWDPDGNPVAGSPFEMTPQASPNYLVGAVFNKSVSLNVRGRYSYAFLAANATGTSRRPQPGARKRGPTVNARPMLEWTLEPHYAIAGVYPSAGRVGQSFTFRVLYSDADGNAPLYVKLRLYKDGVQIPGSPFLMDNDTGATDWTTGVVFTLTKTINERAMYRYSFATSDGMGRATLPTLGRSKAGPRVDNPPVLTWAAIPGYTTGGVSPTSGPAGTFFNFMIKYKDANGDVPVYVKVRIYGPAGGEIAGSPFLMTAVSGTDYVTGVIFARMLSLTEPGTYSYRFMANDGLILRERPYVPAIGPTVVP